MCFMLRKSMMKIAPVGKFTAAPAAELSVFYYFSLNLGDDMAKSKKRLLQILVDKKCNVARFISLKRLIHIDPANDFVRATFLDICT